MQSMLLYNAQSRSEFVCWLQDFYQDDADGNKNDNNDGKLNKRYVDVPYNYNGSGGINDDSE